MLRLCSSAWTLQTPGYGDVFHLASELVAGEAKLFQAIALHEQGSTASVPKEQHRQASAAVILIRFPHVSVVVCA